MTAHNHKREIWTLKQSIKLDPDNSLNYNKLGLIYLHVYNNTQQAISCFKETIYGTNNLFISNSILAKNFLDYTDAQLHNGKEKIWAAKELIKLDPNNASYYYNKLGIDYDAYSSNYQQAALYFRKSIKLNSNGIMYYSNLGNVDAILHNRKEAIWALNKAIKLDPSYASTYNDLGIIYNYYNNYKQASSYYKRAIKLNDQDVLFYSNLGNVDNKLHNYKEEVWALKKLLRLSYPHFCVNPQYYYLFPQYNLIYASLVLLIIIYITTGTLLRNLKKLLNQRKVRPF